jgi:hypothetical protein
LLLLQGNFFSMVKAPEMDLENHDLKSAGASTGAFPLPAALDKYSLLKDLRKRLWVGCDRHLVPAKGFGLVERFIGFLDRGAKVTRL